MLTQVVVEDRRGHQLGVIDVNLAELQEAAESRKNGDPIRQLVELLVEQLSRADLELNADERRRAEKAISQRLVRDQWPPATLSLRGSRVARAPSLPPIRDDTRNDMGKPTELFDRDIVYPNERARRVYSGLVGLDDIKTRLNKEVILLTQPNCLAQWVRTHHQLDSLDAAEAACDGAPLIIFAGDVGTGKTALAESFADGVARDLGQQVVLLRMSVQTRGNGIVGDMTRQITRAFAEVEARARKTRLVTVLLLDEADALAESRETQQMHHEDRAGVNALIQGIDQLHGSDLPVVVIFCSNRAGGIDPAIRRRALDINEFKRPNDAQRRELITRLVRGLPLSDAQIDELVVLTGPREGREYGFTYSDIVSRVIRSAVLDAFPTRPLDFQTLRAVATEIIPTRPFGSGF